MSEPNDTSEQQTALSLPSSSSRRFLTLAQVAEELSISLTQAYALVRRRDLLAIQVGGRGQWRVERNQLEAYIARLYRDAERSPGD